MLTRLLQLASPALPIGAYSYSSALEWGIESGAVRDEAGALEWIEDALALGLGAYEVPLMIESLGHWRAIERAAHPAPLTALNVEALAGRETAELRHESEQMGYSLGQWLRAVCPPTPAQSAVLETLDPLALPVAWALAAERLGLDAREAAIAMLWGFAENQATVLMKALPIGQIAAQRLLLALGPVVEAIATRALEREPALRSNAAPGLAIASSRHETQYSRLFRS
ncbi:MAG: urease accessory protein UreF [Burkholderiales bacterium]|nr:MAG: urease accessory protein UreF [Burkholderiales bacterium]